MKGIFFFYRCKIGKRMKPQIAVELTKLGTVSEKQPSAVHPRSSCLGFLSPPAQSTVGSRTKGESLEIKFWLWHCEFKLGTELSEKTPVPFSKPGFISGAVIAVRLAVEGKVVGCVQQAWEKAGDQWRHVCQAGQARELSQGCRLGHSIPLWFSLLYVLLVRLNANPQGPTFLSLACFLDGKSISVILLISLLSVVGFKQESTPPPLLSFPEEGYSCYPSVLFSVIYPIPQCPRAIQQDFSVPFKMAGSS